MAKLVTEYRINKKGAECFRTMSAEEAYARLKELQAKRPGVYTMQRRTVQLDRYGVMLASASGNTLWSAWY
ncbi:MAG: hypothetical protein IJH78_06695 [Clostridia bacterium]|nr:hypothetical protein [Clostridia bacterium]